MLLKLPRLESSVLTLESPAHQSLRAVNPGVSDPPRPDQLLWCKDMSFDKNSKFVDEIGLGWSNKSLCGTKYSYLQKRKINPNKTKHQYIPIETRDIKK
jgi:hypothetical protein